MTNVVALAAKVQALQGEVNELRGRVRDLEAKVEKYQGYAEACQSAIGKLAQPMDALAGVSIDLGGMRSSSLRISAASAAARDVKSDLARQRSKVSDARSRLREIGQKYERKADEARSRLRGVRTRLEAAESELASARSQLFSGGLL